jgi:hypothetical protein
MSSVGHEEQLWCAVIDQALFDAQSKRTSVQAQREKQEALRWLLIPNKDFDVVCSLALLDPDAVRDRVRRMTGGGSRVQENSL